MSGAGWVGKFAPKRTTAPLFTPAVVFLVATFTACLQEEEPAERIGRLEGSMTMTNLDASVSVSENENVPLSPPAPSVPDSGATVPDVGRSPPIEPPPVPVPEPEPESPPPPDLDLDPNVECRSSSECKEPLPHCVGGKCSECRGDADCGSTAYCLPMASLGGTRLCSICKVNSDCPGPFNECRIDGICCSASSSPGCTGCRSDSDCRSGYYCKEVMPGVPGRACQR